MIYWVIVSMTCRTKLEEQGYQTYRNHREKNEPCSRSLASRVIGVDKRIHSSSVKNHACRAVSRKRDVIGVNSIACDDDKNAKVQK